MVYTKIYRNMDILDPHRELKSSLIDFYDRIPQQ